MEDKSDHFKKKKTKYAFSNQLHDVTEKALGLKARQPEISVGITTYLLCDFGQVN